MATSFSGGRSRSTQERTTDHEQATGKLYHLRLGVECTLFVIFKVKLKILLKVALNTINQIKSLEPSYNKMDIFPVFLKTLHPSY
jgi:hypothetical protein